MSPVLPVGLVYEGNTRPYPPTAAGKVQRVGIAAIFARRRTANYSPTADLDQGRFYHASSYHVKGFCPGTHSNSLAQTTIRPFSVEYSQVDRVSSFSPYSGTMFRGYRDISSISAMPSSNSSFVAGSRKR